MSLFPRWRGPVIDQVWRKRRVEDGDDGGGAAVNLFGARRATTALHPLGDLPPDACTEQLGVPGPWLDRLPHFRLDHTPSHGDELQSEFFVGREHAVAAFEALDALRDRLAPLVFVSEIRTIAADDLWLSPAYGRDSVAFHFTWRPDWPAVRALLPDVEAALEPFEPRPHGRSCSRWPPRSCAPATCGWASSRHGPRLRPGRQARQRLPRQVRPRLRRPTRSTANMARSRRAPVGSSRTPSPGLPTRPLLCGGISPGSRLVQRLQIDKFLTPDGPSLRLVMARDPGHPVSVGEIVATGMVDRPARIADAPTWRGASVEGRTMKPEAATSIAGDAQRAFVLNDRPLIVDLIELTLNHGLFVVRAAAGLRRGQRGSWRRGARTSPCSTWTTRTPPRSCNAWARPTRCDPAGRRSSA